MHYVDEWQGCYRLRWGEEITPESFAHPAKISFSLAEKIYAHLEEDGVLTPGARVIDCFGGIGGTALHAMLRGCHWTGVELEEKFVRLAEANLALWRRKYAGWPKLGTARIIQGDSRNLAALVQGAEVAVSSPPFLGGSDGNAGPSGPEANARIKAAAQALGKPMEKVAPFEAGRKGKGAYGQTEGQLGAMREGSFQAAVASPPFLDSLNNKPSSQILAGSGGRMGESCKSSETYGHTEGQLGSMREGSFTACVSSPPYEGSLNAQTKGGIDWTKTFDGKDHRGQGQGSNGARPESYSADADNLGNATNSTFWEAARAIVAQTYTVLAPGARVVWIVKSFVRKKQLVDFPGQWRALCESVGFVTLHEHHALLTETWDEHQLWGTERKEVARKSFFRRLAEKNGSPAINYEVVWCTEKPDATTTEMTRRHQVVIERAMGQEER